MLMLKLMMSLVLWLWMVLSVTAMEYTWQDRMGKTASLQTLVGQPVILHFWASWCPPCKTEMPALVAWQKVHPNVQLIAISLDKHFDQAIQYLDASSIAFEANHGDQKKALELGVRALPMTFIIDATGKVVRREIGARPWSDPHYSHTVMQMLVQTSD